MYSQKYKKITTSLPRIEYHPEAITMDIDYFDGWIGFQVLPYAGHKDIHAPGCKIIFFAPDLYKGIVTGKDAIFGVAKHFKEL